MSLHMGWFKTNPQQLSLQFRHGVHTAAGSCHLLTGRTEAAPAFHTLQKPLLTAAARARGAARWRGRLWPNVAGIWVSNMAAGVGAKFDAGA